MASRKRLRWHWGPLPARAAEKSAAISEAPKRVPGKKDTRRWCHGKEGREHALEITDRNATRGRCEWAPAWSLDGIRWDCRHQESCTACGKIMREPWQLALRDCPRYPGTQAQRAAAERQLAETRERIEAARARRRHVITGPQGYRRKRGAA